MSIDNYIALIGLVITSSLTIWSTIYAAKTNKKISDTKNANVNFEKSKTIITEFDEPLFKLGGVIFSALLLIGLFIYSKFNLNWIVVISISLASISLTINVMVYYLYNAFYSINKLLHFHRNLADTVNNLTETVSKIIDNMKNDYS